MRNSLLLLALLAGLPQAVLAAAPQLETCVQIRSKIGALPLADGDLMRQLASRTDCRFTSNEVYAAAYGGEMPSYRERAYYRWTGEGAYHRHHHEHWDD